MGEKDKSIARETPTPRKGQGCLNFFFLFAVLCWILGISFLRHLTVFFITINPTPSIQIPAFFAAIAQILLVGIPLIPLALYFPSKQFQAIYQSLLLAWIAALCYLPGVAIDPSAAQAYTLLHILLTLFYIWMIAQITTRLIKRNSKPGISYTQKHADKTQVRLIWSISISVSVMAAIPWLIYGAFGSLFDIILQASFSLAVGIATTLIIDNYIHHSSFSTSKNPLQVFFLNGITIGGILLLISSSLTYGYSGIQIILMLILPALGWIISALYLSGWIIGEEDDSEIKIFKRIKGLFPLTIIIGMIIAAPLSLVDPDELVLVLNATSGEILSFAFRATFFTILIILSLSIIIYLVSIHLRKKFISKNTSLQKISIFLQTIVIMILGLSFVIYLKKGQPGLYGESIFVILKNQTTFESFPETTDHLQAREFVYMKLVNNANSTQKNLRNTLDRFGIPYTPYFLVNAIETPNNPFIRIWLSFHPDVDRILPSPNLRPLPEPLPINVGPHDSFGDSQWNISLIGADKVWEEFGVTGSGITIGQSDSGVQNDHPELANSYRGKSEGHEYNWFDPWNHSLSPIDLGGHGTHTLGSIVGQNVGVAPDAKWFACVNLARNLANPAKYLDCMQFMLAPFPLNGDAFTQGDPSKGADIINNSWGCPEIEGCDASVFLPAVTALRTAGIFEVASAGNDGPKCGSLNYPLPIYDEVFSVGAIDRTGNLASFSSIGPVSSDGSQRVKPDILAPGVSIVSSTPGDTYAFYSGTSMAGPHIAGVVALMWSANPSLIGNIDLTEQILIQSATPYTGELPDCPGVKDIPSNAYGFGIVNAYEAVRIALEYPQ